MKSYIKIVKAMFSGNKRVLAEAFSVMYGFITGGLLVPKERRGQNGARHPMSNHSV